MFFKEFFGGWREVWDFWVKKYPTHLWFLGILLFGAFLANSVRELWLAGFFMGVFFWELMVLLFFLFLLYGMSVVTCLIYFGKLFKAGNLRVRDYYLCAVVFFFPPLTVAAAAVIYTGAWNGNERLNPNKPEEKK